MLDPQSFDLTAYRDGQRRAHTVVLERVAMRQAYTTIVLPCGYGKSDLIRTVALDAWQQQLISTCVVLHPNTVLRDQLVHREKMAAWHQRYQIAVPGLLVRVLSGLVPNFTSNGEFLVSTNIHLVERNRDFFVQWVDAQCHRWGRPPLFCIDEAQTESIDNVWGETIMALVHAGALAMLVTATPERSDGKPIPGFACEEVDTQEELLTLYRNTEDPLMKEQLLYASTLRTWRLVPDHETTFSEAWSEGVIANIDRFPYDIQCEELSNTVNLPAALLSTIPQSRVEGYLGRIMREASVMREGVKIFTEALAALRHTVPECAGMVFVSNDVEPVRAVNAHAKAIEKLIYDYQPTWKTVIATSSDGDQAIEALQQFADDATPVGDVLLVKQMAARGLDTPRCKVLLDLSPVRAPVGWTQRIMRINRLYKGLSGVYICVNDVLSRTLFETVVRSASARTQDYRDIGELLEKNLIPVLPKEEWRTLYVGEMTAAEFSDSKDLSATAAEHPIARYLCHVYPALAAVDTRAGLITNLRGWTPPPHYQSPLRERAEVLAKDERDTINTILRRIARQRLGETATDDASFGTMMQSLWNDIKPRFGLGLATAFGTVDDLKLLEAIKKYVLTVEQQERRASHAP